MNFNPTLIAAPFDDKILQLSIFGSIAPRGKRRRAKNNAIELSPKFPLEIIINILKLEIKEAEFLCAELMNN